MAVSEGEIGPGRAWRSRLEEVSIRRLSRKVMEFFNAYSGAIGNALSEHFDKAGLQARAATLPLLLEFRPVAEGLLSSYLGCGKRSVEICARQSLLLRHTFAQKNREAADESISRAGRVYGLDLECGNQLHPPWSRRQRAALAESNDDALHSLVQ